jgi:uncharacterized membrane protein
VRPFTALAAENQKAAHVAALATTSTGVATYFDAIAPVVGVIASIVGIVFTCVLIGINIRRDRREKRECDLQLEVLRKQLKGRGDDG